MNRLISIPILLLLLTFQYVGNGQIFSAFTFRNINPTRYGLAITNGDTPLQGLLELRSKGSFLTRYSKEDEPFIKTVWSKEINLRPFQQKIIILPLDVYISSREAHRFFFKETNSNEQEKTIHFKSLDLFILVDNTLQGFKIKEWPDIGGDSNTQEIFYASEAFLPKKQEDYFFGHLLINLTQLEKLSERNYQNIRNFTIEGGSLILIDDLPAKKKPGKRAIELLPLKFGNKISTLQKSFAEALTSNAVNPKKLPLFRNFTYTFKSKEAAAGLPAYRSLFAEGLITYFAFDLNKTGHPESFLKIYGSFMNRNNYNKTLLKDLMKHKKDKVVFDFWDYLFSFISNPMILVALGVSIFYIIFFITMIFKFKKKAILCIKNNENHKSYLPRMWSTCILIIILISITHFILGSKGLSFSYLEEEKLYPRSEKKQIKNILHITTQTPISTKLEWKNNIPNLVFSKRNMYLGDLQKCFKNSSPTIRLNTQGKKLLGFRSLIEENKFLNGQITLNKNVKLTGHIINNTVHVFSKAYLAYPVEGDSDYRYSTNINVLPELKPGEKLDLSKISSTTVTSDQNDIVNSIKNGIGRTLYSPNILPGKYCYFIGITDNFYFNPYFASAHKASLKKKIVIQKIPFTSLLELDESNSSDLTCGSSFPLSDIELPKEQKKKAAEKFGFGYPKSSILYNSSIIANTTLPLDGNINTMFLSLDFKTQDQQAPPNGDLLVEILNLQTKKWELIYKENLKQKTEDIQNLRKELIAFRSKNKPQIKKKLNKKFSSMFRNRKRHGKNKPYADIVVKITNWEKYCQPNYSKLYFKFTHKGKRETLIINDPEITYSSQ